ncbi:MinD-like ATPase involved in chromosome partitioning or flagellar assembly [Micromonospora nigra]|uniref:MinD-like ATPase involved in chromosome partitioning or flagellar assembly n=1 Tax=Micromonospora nigra TaxID=145857 RepID=A0A1C6S2K7_9ACTN|nr:ParA family protein [Micromonospora nigra]SCL23493.1 MinD-like ATPase involved in chromosome partitioning or flagellar assembly [Micromonospora nigra]
MVDENADRSHTAGQHGVPERDIEPLWPPDQIEAGPGFDAPAWGAPPPSVPGPPAVPPGTGQHPPAVPPSPVDYPSLTDEPPASGWAAGHVGRGTVPPPADGPGPDAPGPYPYGSPAARHGGQPFGGTAVHGGPPVPSASVGPVPPAPAPAPVDLDLPFTLDQPTALTPAGEVVSATDPAAASGGTTEAEPDRDAAAPARPTGPTAGNPVPTAGNPADSPVLAGGSTVPGVGSGSPDAGPSGNDDDRIGDGSAPRAPQSPWAQPPQRTAPETAAPRSADVPPAPTWAAPATYLPTAPDPQVGLTTPDPPRSGLSGAPLPPSPGPPGTPAAATSGTPVAPSPGQPGTPVAGSPGQPGTPATPPPGPAYGSASVPGQQPTPAPPGPFPPQPAWGHPMPWQQGAAGGAPPPGYPPNETARPPAPAYPEPAWNPDAGAAPTAEDFARRRQVRPADPVATMGVRAMVNKTGLVKLAPGRHEQELKRDIETVRRNFGGLRQVTVVNPKGGAGKTVAILLLAMTFGQKRGGYVLAWDNNETQGTLGMRAQQDFHSRTVRDLLRDLGQFHGAHGRVGDLSQYVRSQGEGMFDVLASDESATGGEMLTASAFGEIREVVSRFYKLIFVDTGNNVRAQNWQAAMDATDQLVVTMSARNDSAETAARMLDHLEQSGRQRLVRQAVTVVSMPPSRKEIDLPAIQEHFAARTRAVLLAPYERLIDTGEPIRYNQLSAATRDAWLKIAASVAEGL